MRHHSQFLHFIQATLNRSASLPFLISFFESNGTTFMSQERLLYKKTLFKSTFILLLLSMVFSCTSICNKNRKIDDNFIIKQGDEDKNIFSPQIIVTKSNNTEQNNEVKSENKPKALSIEKPNRATKFAMPEMESWPIIPEYSPDIKAPEKYKHPLNDATKLTFMLGTDDKGNYLYGEGRITEGAYAKFIKYVEFYKNKKINLNRLMLHSPGGLVNEGLNIGSYIRENNWITDSDRHMKCYSSCGFIFASGVEKRIQDGAKIGFHRPYLPNKEDTSEFIEKVYQDYKPFWNLINGDEELYDTFMINYGRDEMLILDSISISKYMAVETY